MVQNSPVYEVIKTATFERWVGRLRDKNAVTRIYARVDNAEIGRLGDVRSLGGQMYEMRMDYGPGYRLYFLRQGDSTLVFLFGGDKDSQRRDIPRSRQLAQEWRARSV
ncbi:MAG: type II toxin-antitoxin system RelE/ParE family toxin [Chloroflexi bacterium]|nr:type II toxin-antitoxin system RelE/ParE family toxin [Chloroflexota bacterium]MYE41604.1 type II toxin-antitoxin system RelE/ParE family toxin [Chloroflexota bacterium]